MQYEELVKELKGFELHCMESGQEQVAELVFNAYTTILKLKPFERMCKMSGQNIGLRLMNAEEDITQLNSLLDRLVGPCKIESISSRVCGRGTKSCTIYHAEYPGRER